MIKYEPEEKRALARVFSHMSRVPKTCVLDIYRREIKESPRHCTILVVSLPEKMQVKEFGAMLDKIPVKFKFERNPSSNSLANLVFLEGTLLTWLFESGADLVEAIEKEKEKKKNEKVISLEKHPGFWSKFVRGR